MKALSTDRNITNGFSLNTALDLFKLYRFSNCRSAFTTLYVYGMNILRNFQKILTNF